jgi:hypothetical protein
MGANKIALPKEDSDISVDLLQPYFYLLNYQIGRLGLRLPGAEAYVIRVFGCADDFPRRERFQ